MIELLKGNLHFKLEVEGGKRSKFIKKLKEHFTSEIHQLADQRHIEIMKSRYKKIVAYKHFQFGEDLANFNDCVCKAYKEFEFLNDVIDKTLNTDFT